jgi:hypothetical protein
MAIIPATKVFTVNCTPKGDTLKKSPFHSGIFVFTR